MKDINFLRNSNVDVDKSLELLGDIDTYNDILKEFLNGSKEKLELLKKYKDINDLANYAIYAHSLKSDARYLGFSYLAELSYNHEIESKKGNFEYINNHYDELIKEASSVISLVRAYFEDESDNAQSLINNSSNDNKKAILVVDDSSIIRNLIEKMVSSEYTVISAIDGQEAIAEISKNKDVLVGMLLDLNMPNMNGFTVLEYLKGNNLLKEIPVVIITGDDSKETVYKAFDYQIVDVLAKPFNERDVKRVISAMIMYKQE